MDIEYLDNINDIGEAFKNRFVLSWDRFQSKHKERIAKMGLHHDPFDRKWYDQSYMWDRMEPACPGVSMKEALDYLREHSGPILFMTEKGEREYFQGAKSIAFIAKADAHLLADRIESEWYESYRPAGHRELSDTLPDDLYVFDLSLKWCVVFTHETVDREEEHADGAREAAQSRYCLICRE